VPLERGDIGKPTNGSDDDYGSSPEWKYLSKGFITDNEGTWTTCRLMLFAAMIYVRNRRKYNNYVLLSHPASLCHEVIKEKDTVA